MLSALRVGVILQLFADDLCQIHNSREQTWQTTIQSQSTRQSCTVAFSAKKFPSRKRENLQDKDIIHVHRS